MSQSFTSFLCNHCGAPLQVQAETRFCTCSYCGTNLKVHQDGGTTYSEVLGELQERTKRIDENVQAIRLHQELEALDRDWEMEERRLSSAKKNGSHSIPNKEGAIIVGIIPAVFGTVFTGIGLTSGAPVWFALFGLVFVVGGIVAASTMYEKAVEYEAKKKAHDQKKEELLREIDKSS